MTPKYAHELQAGDAYEGYTFTITPELHQQLLFAVEDYNLLYLEGSDTQAPILHPVALLQMTPRTRSPSFAQAPGMGSALARDRVVWLAPARVGQHLRVDWHVTCTYGQRGRIYQDYVATVHDEAGTLIFRRETSSTFFALAARGAA
jgi:hypothetical protein